MGYGIPTSARSHPFPMAREVQNEPCGPAPRAKLTQPRRDENLSQIQGPMVGSMVHGYVSPRRSRRSTPEARSWISYPTTVPLVGVMARPATDAEVEPLFRLAPELVRIPTPMTTLVQHLHDAFHDPDTRIHRIVQGSIWALIVLAIALLVGEAVLAETNPIHDFVVVADQVLLTIFVIEIVLRVATLRPPALEIFRRPPLGRFRTHVMARISFVLRPIILVDILAVLAVFPELRGLRALRLLRLLRTTRVFRYRNPFAIVIHAFEENGLLFALAFSVLGVTTLLGGVSFYLVEIKHNADVDSMIDALWWALVTITTVGFGDITPETLLGRIIGAVLMVAGMFTLALFAGIVGSSLVHGMLSIREEQFRMSDHVNHLILCGHDESTQLLLAALSAEPELGRSPIVIIDDKERPRDLSPGYLWVQGDPTKESELDKVRLTHAAAVIVSGKRDIAPQDADARTILITFTIRRYLQRNDQEVRERRDPLYLVVEILDSENVDHAQAAGADEVIETRKIGYSMIAHAVGYHGTATAMSGVLLSGAHNVYIGKIPGDRKDPISFGDLMLELKLSKRGGLVVGLRTVDGEEIINPPKSCMLPPDAQLLYLAEEPLLDPV